MLIPFERLSSKMQKMPEVRSLYLEVEQLTRAGDYAEYRVSDPRRKTVHLCKIHIDTSLCDCIAATFGTICAHSHAALSHHKKGIQLMVDYSNLSTTKPGQAVSLKPHRPGGDDYEPQQAVILEPGYYAAFLSSFSAPKSYEKFGGGGQEMKTSIRFLVTHGINERILPRFSLAQCFIPFKFFYNHKTQMKSTYFSLIHALVAKKYTEQQLADALEDAVPTLADLVGRPLIIEVKTARNPDKNGIFANNASNFKPVSSTIAQALIPTYKALKIEISQTNGFPRITDPKPEYQEKIYTQNLPSQDQNSSADYDYPASEIPF